ncbi:MAG TPA: hypothetical protein VHY09_04595 [Candidatus Methylacidiphilales bacterium]|jgi:hypothetical protein|nr:hypothetical protein [Candidatus Methylacidiphilales bacterium]
MKPILLLACAAAAPLFLSGCAVGVDDAYVGPAPLPPPPEPPPPVVTYYAPDSYYYSAPVSGRDADNE